MNQQSLIEGYLNNSGEGHRKTASCRYDRDTFYSYDHAICMRITANVYVLRRDSYSRTTVKHVNAGRREVPENCLIIADFWNGGDIAPVAFEDALRQHMIACDKESSKATTAPDIRVGEVEVAIALRNLKIWKDNLQEIYEYETI